MCGRITLTSSSEQIAEVFGLSAVPALRPRYNIAPTQMIAAVRVDAGDRARRICELRWGLVPTWARDPAIGNRLINARAETIAEKVAFRSAFLSRRCLVLADGYYEWRKVGKAKQPYLIRRCDHAPFALAGLWERWRSSDQGTLESCTIITTTANPLTLAIHDRMPVIIAPHDVDTWLDADLHEREQLAHLLHPADECTPLALTPVGTYVNDPRHDDARCFDPPDPEVA